MIGTFARTCETFMPRGISLGNQEYRLGYRSDIEGLRAVAILLVVAAHAKVTWLAGGFVGVDVFFVLSGYLITGILWREISETGGIRFANFYARRFRRLLPALLTMLACTCLFAAAALPPGDQGSQATGAATAALWLSNIYFAFAHINYFDPNATSNLFLHTWSLGVEEQFYLIWPALMVLTLGWWRSEGAPAGRLITVMSVIAIVSLLACLSFTQTAPRMAFYLMPWRAWQFAIGSLVWLRFGSIRGGGTSDLMPLGSALAYRGLGWLGLALILISALWFDANTSYPGWHALLPTIGAAAVILAGIHSAGNSGISRVLSWSPLQRIGRLSYSWYLWHWPVLLLGGAIFVTDSALYRAALVILSLLIAAWSYRWVESPIRQQARWTIRPAVTVLSALALMAFVNVACITWFNAAGAWQGSPTQQRYAVARSDIPAIYKMGCDEWYYSDKVKPCVFGPDNAAHTAVLIGDSIGGQWFPAVFAVFNRPDWRLVVLTKSACPMVDELMFYPRIGRNYTECTIWRRQALRDIAKMRPDIVVMGSVQTSDFTQTQWVEGTARVLKTISDASGHIYLLRGTPHLPFDGPNCLSSRSWWPWLHPWKSTCDAPAYSARDNDVYRWLQQASSGFVNVEVVDLNSKVCPGNTCHAESHGRIIFRDSQHLTATFVESLSAHLANILHLEAPSQADPPR
ncbi:acyltransferase family protein [Rhodanobacter sp. AS-Z3]|uniref:acyltransferase family protein n=1 Tax=Rhodanobacter sp. AS-Z3 TaxID=3031330 RepID=UPI002479BABA|nr:acyltransferase family protein [Rhodanobacter sp. AS-Z3]WEN16345.1 acyltransferase family protein [Rhodanobacter sp. AS-Z3]